MKVKDFSAKILCVMLCLMMIFSSVQVFATEISNALEVVSEVLIEDNATAGLMGTKQSLTVPGKEYPFVTEASTQIGNIHTTYGYTRATMPYLVFKLSETAWKNFDINLQMYDGSTPKHNSWSNCIFLSTSNEEFVTKVEKDATIITFSILQG